jgi:glucose/arabinose dehydrogenase
VDIANAGDSRIFVVDQDGEIVVFDSTGASLGTFLDIQERVIAGGERGLLGLAFHPDYASNGFFYVNYTRDPDDMTSGESGEGDTRVSRFSRIGAAGSNVADPTSELPIIDIPQPFSNHNAGDLNFGPDGNLWIAMGDGGAGCDPGDVSQDPAEILGKVLRLDVDGGSPYVIPADNPYVGPDGIPDEIWSFGLRNPFRFSFDRSTGDLWIADVGQNSWEEVNFAPAASIGGENYGWDCREGLHDAGAAPPVGSNCNTTAPCVGPLTDPVHEYSHGGGRCSVTGGYVYRGATYASLIGGYYFFADYCSSDLYALSPGSCPGTFITHSFGTPVSNPSAFGESDTGELLVASLGGTVYRLTASGTPTVPGPCNACSSTPLMSCRQPAATKAKLLLKNDPNDDDKDKLIWTWLKGDPTPKEAFGDPDVFDSTLCIYAGTAQNLVVESSIPGSLACPSCWSETTPGFKYNVPGGGIEKILLKSGTEPGKAKIILKGKGAALPSLPGVPVTPPLLVQMSNTQGECWEASYGNAIKNENDFFKAKSD